MCTGAIDSASCSSRGSSDRSTESTVRPHAPRITVVAAVSPPFVFLVRLRRVLKRHPSKSEPYTVTATTKGTAIKTTAIAVAVVATPAAVATPSSERGITSLCQCPTCSSPRASFQTSEPCSVSDLKSVANAIFITQVRSLYINAERRLNWKPVAGPQPSENRTDPSRENTHPNSASNIEKIM